MSINKNKPHLLILPEDDANRQIINGFIQNLNVNNRAIQILPIADGWKKTVDKFTNDHIKAMRQYPQRNILLIIAFSSLMKYKIICVYLRPSAFNYYCLYLT
ncbi:hypothetical protein [Anabaena sp. UHCC 0253]|uniref:hypothetical protein n=1 Tax=Anabaena sp. UHCC 0253 TaxID=2590019 RepID=UPI001580ED8B|nr:hypothetical protein [Anabaena sp. UHCC 0253]